MAQSMFQGRPQGLEVERVVNAIRDQFKEGDLVPYKTIDPWLESYSRHGTSRFNGIMAKVKREFLKQTGIQLVAVPGEGYQLCTGIEQVTHAVGHAARAVRLMRRGATIAEHVEDNRLTSVQREARDKFVRETKYHDAVLRAARRPILIQLKAVGEATSQK